MNLVDAFVKKVISGPYEEYGKWWIDVEYISWGVPGKTRLMFESKEQALEVKEGYKFLSKRLVRTVLIFTESSDQLSRATDRVPGLPASPGYVQ